MDNISVLNNDILSAYREDKIKADRKGVRGKVLSIENNNPTLAYRLIPNHGPVAQELNDNCVKIVGKKGLISQEEQSSLKLMLFWANNNPRVEGSRDLTQCCHRGLSKRIEGDLY